MGSFVTTYYGEDLHMHDVRATKLNRLLRQIYFHENNYQVYAALFKYVVSVKEIYKSLIIYTYEKKRGKVGVVALICRLT